MAQPGHGGRRQGVGWPEGRALARRAHRTRSSSMSQCRCIAAEAARFCTHISTPPMLASSSPVIWRTVSASISWREGAVPPASFPRGTQCGIAHQCARASTPEPVSSACHACSRRGGSGASSVGRRGLRIARKPRDAARRALGRNVRPEPDVFAHLGERRTRGSSGQCCRALKFRGLSP